MRKDGRRIKTLDAFFSIIPMVMTTRTECTNHCTYDLDFSRVERFVRERKAEGIHYSYMSVVTCAYMRMVSKYPHFNRFVVNRRVFARKGFSVSFILLKEGPNGETMETAIKLPLNLDDTLAEVHKKLEQAIASNRVTESSNITDKLIKTIMGIPMLPRAIVALIMWMDRRGIMPKSIVEASPFHTGLFLSNLASINLESIHHHLYEFGTCSVFFTFGNRKRYKVGEDTKTTLPISVAADDRICGGITWAKGLKVFTRCLNNPESMESKAGGIAEDIL